MRFLTTILLCSLLPALSWAQTITALTVTNGSSIYSVEVDGKIQVVSNPVVYYNGFQTTIGTLVDYMSKSTINITLSGNVITATGSSTAATTMTSNNVMAQETYYRTVCDGTSCYQVPMVRNVVRNMVHATLPPYNGVYAKNYGAYNYGAYNYGSNYYVRSGTGCGCTNPNCACGAQNLGLATGYGVSNYNVMSGPTNNGYIMTTRQARVTSRRAWLSNIFRPFAPRVLVY